MASRLQKSLCLIGITIVFLASSSAAFECYSCDDDRSHDPGVSKCTNISFSFKTEQCEKEKACVRTVQKVLQDDGTMKETVYRGCQNSMWGVSKEEWEDLIKEKKCLVKNEETICPCRGSFCNEPTECYRCSKGIPFHNSYPTCSDESSPSYKVQCEDYRPCASMVIDSDKKLHGCMEDIDRYITENESLQCKCITEKAVQGEATLCTCQSDLGNSAASQRLKENSAALQHLKENSAALQHLNNLMKIICTLFLLINLRRFF